MESGRRSHTHGHASSATHDAHIRHHSDKPHMTHLGNAVRHLEGMHGEAGSLRTDHWSHAGEPKPHATKDSPGV